jgi:hypothetical protein
MSNNYDLDQDGVESFRFKLGGNEYDMRYPTTEEIQSAQKMKDEDAKTKWVYTFITPVVEASPPIEEALKKVNVKVLQKFNHMIKTEFTEDA